METHSKNKEWSNEVNNDGWFERFTMLKEIKMSLDTWKRVRGTYLLYPYCASHWTAQLSAKKPSWFTISLERESEKV